MGRPAVVVGWTWGFQRPNYGQTAGYGGGERWRERADVGRGAADAVGWFHRSFMLRFGKNGIRQEVRPGPIC